MRTLIMWNVITLDGCVEGSTSWDLPWHEQVWGPELERLSLEQLGSCEMLLFGRVTYEGMAAHWQSATGAIADFMNRLPKVVCSRTLRMAEWNNSTLLSGDAANTITTLKTQGNGSIFVFGSADLSRTLMREGLFDEYRLAIAPSLHGNGRPLFPHGTIADELRLLEATALSNGCVILRYRVSAIRASGSGA